MFAEVEFGKRSRLFLLISNRSTKLGLYDRNKPNVLLHGNQILEGVKATEQNIERSKNQNEKDKKRGFLKVDGNKDNQ